MCTELKIAVTCGGTGGHVFPGVATAKNLANRGYDVALVLSGRDGESANAVDWQGAILEVYCPKPQWNTPLGIYRSVRGLLMAVVIARRRFRVYKPSVLLAMGSYTSFGPIIAAKMARIPVVLHDANVVPGAAVSLFSRWAKTVAVSFDETRAYLPPKANIVKTGLPIRTELARRYPLWMPAPEKKTILVMGGSQGARAINQMAIEAVKLLTQRFPRQWRVMHLAGRAEEDSVRKAYEASSLPMDDIEVYGFLGDMGGAYASADFCICRSGASSCFELALCGPVPIFIPLPTAARDHQTANAKAFADKGAAILMPQKGLTALRLAQTLVDLRQRQTDCDTMRERLHALAQPDATENLANAVLAIALGA